MVVVSRVRLQWVATKCEPTDGALCAISRSISMSPNTIRKALAKPRAAACHGAPSGTDDTRRPLIGVALDVQEHDAADAGVHVPTPPRQPPARGMIAQRIEI